MWRDFWEFAKQEKKWWIIPLVVTLFLLGLVVYLASSGVGAVLGPLLYPF